MNKHRISPLGQSVLDACKSTKDLLDTREKKIAPRKIPVESGDAKTEEADAKTEEADAKEETDAGTNTKAGTGKEESAKHREHLLKLQARVKQIEDSVEMGLYFANQLDAPIMYNDWLGELQDMNVALMSGVEEFYKKYVDIRCARYGV